MINKKKNKTEAQTYLKDLFTYEEAYSAIEYGDEPTDDIDAERWANRQPFFISQVSKPVKKKKKIIVNDIGPVVGLLDQGHEVFYKNLFSQGMEIYVLLKEDDKFTTKKVTSYAELANHFKQTPNISVQTKKLLPSLLKIPVDSFELIDHDRRLEITNEIGALDPLLRIATTRFHQLPDLSEYSEEYTKTFYQDKKLLSLEIPSEDLLKAIDFGVANPTNYAIVTININEDVNNPAYDKLFEKKPAIQEVILNQLASQDNNYPNEASDDTKRIIDLAFNSASRIATLKITGDLKTRFNPVDIIESKMAQKDIYLSSLELSFLNFDKNDLNRTLNCFPHLKALHLSHVTGDYGNRLLENANLAHETKLEELSVFICPITLVELLVFISHNPQLKSIKAIEGYVPEYSVPELDRLLDNFPILAVEELNINYQLTSVQLAKLVNKCPNLKELTIDIENSNFRFDEFLLALDNKSITHLHLKCSSITSASLYQCLTALPLLSNLTIDAGVIATPDLDKKLNLPPKLNLKKLKFDADFESERAVNLSIIKPILSASSETLTSLALLFNSIDGDNDLHGIALPKLKELTYGYGTEVMDNSDIKIYSTKVRSTLINILRSTSSLKNVIINPIGDINTLKDFPNFMDASIVEECHNSFLKLRSLYLQDGVNLKASFLNRLHDIAKELTYLTIEFHSYFPDEPPRSSSSMNALTTLTIKGEDTLNLQNIFLNFHAANVKQLFINSSEFLNINIDPDKFPNLEYFNATSIGLTPEYFISLAKNHPHLSLVELARAGDDGAADELFEEYYSTLILTINEILSKAKVNFATPFIFHKNSTPAAQTLTDRSTPHLDSNTDTAQSTFNAKCYFEDSNPILDRHATYLGIKFENGKANFIEHKLDLSKTTPVTVTQLETNALLQEYDRLKPYNPNLRLGREIYTIKPGEWLPLPSCSQIEQLFYINKDVDICYDTETRKHFFKLKDHVITTQKLDLRFIEYVQDNNYINVYSQETLAPYLAMVENLRFDSNGIIKDLNYYQLILLSKNDLAAVFYNHIARFPNEVKELSGNLQTDSDILNALNSQHSGACRHRTFLFSALASAFGIPHLAQFNDAHAFAEVFDTSNPANVSLVKMDFGGYPGHVNKITNNLRGEDESEQTNLFAAQPAEYDAWDLSLLTESNPTALSDQMPLHLFDDFELTEDHGHHTTPTDFDSFISQQLEIVSQFDPEKRNILIAIEDDQVPAFQASLLRYYHDKKQKMFYVPNLDAISDKTGIVKDGSVVFQPSILNNFVTTANSQDALIVNWSNYNNLHLGHNSIMDSDNRRIGTTSIPEGMINIGFITRSELGRLDDDITSRFKVYAECPGDFLINQPYKDALPLKNLPESEVIIPFYSEYWRDKLIGQIHPGEKINYIESELVKAIKNNKAGIVLHNAPWHLEEFQLFYNELSINRSFMANGEKHQLPDHFTIKRSDEPFELNLSHVTVQDGYSKSAYVLNQHTLPQFIKGLQSKNKTVQTFDGIFASHSNTTLDVYVTDSSISYNQWAWFLAEAEKKHCSVNLSVAPGVEIPEIIRDLNKNEFSSMELSSTDNSIKVVETPDLEAAEQWIEKYFPNSSVISVHEATTFTELAGHLKKPTEGDGFNFDFEYSHIYELLKLGKTVVLKGDLPEKTRLLLEPMFTDDPYLYINGQKHQLPGRLVLLTTQHKAIPFVTSNVVTITNEQKWQQLSAYITDKPMFDKFRQASQAIEKHTDYHFSYSQLKTMLQKLEAGNRSNPFAPFFRLFPDNKLAYAKQIWPRLTEKKANPTTSDTFDERRKAKLLQQLSSSPYTFIVGPSGAGKSTFLLKSFKDDPDRELSIGADQMLDWALNKDGKEKILFLDEANLERPGLWENLEGIFDNPPGVIIKNKYYPLTEKHKIIFAGNYANFEGRFQHNIFDKHGNVVTFKELPDFFIRERIIAPALKKLFTDPAFPSSEIEDIFLSFYKKVNTKISQTTPLTPRNINTMALRFKLYTEKYSKYFTGDDTFQRMACMAAFDEVSTALSKDERKLLKQEIHTSGLLREDQRKDIKTRIKEEAAAVANDELMVTKSRKNPVRLLKDGLALREMKLNDPTLQDLYAPGLLYEGGSGIGKSAMILSSLRAMDYKPATQANLDENKRFYVFTPGKREEMIRQLRRAFHEGAVILIDEFNGLGLEKELNAFLSGFDLDGKRADKSGFYIIATQNPVSMKKRPMLSEALLKRLQKVDLKDYTTDELVEVMTSLTKNPDQAKSLVKDYIKIREKEDKENILFKSTPRTLFDKAEKPHKEKRSRTAANLDSDSSPGNKRQKGK